MDPKRHPVRFGMQVALGMFLGFTMIVAALVGFVLLLRYLF
jgi:hypothetical protein